MGDKKIDRILKLIYFFIGIKIAVFAFVISLLVDLAYKPINMILSVSLAALLVGILVLLYFLIALVFNTELLERKTSRSLVGIVGMMVGLVLGSMLVWVLLYNFN
ncbi:hypothetical protein [Maribacter sp.]|uniref:hypothetical protein n=1 Tax=Maribacter sp. TaxID=1897614 RepID=UPI0025C516DE|nr:hypothetical protein [Maribacter sp.]